ncbi:MAG: ECF-type sigma factor [Acidobacteria bacterium]|nr:ECF-type sigma factor [Acidobacteriota bacterium]
MCNSIFLEALQRAGSGDAAAVDEVMELAYPELKRQARHALAMERHDHTLQPTALVHEVWLKLNGEQGMYESRARFFGLASRAIRQILVDHARKRLTAKRIGWSTHVVLDEEVLLSGGIPLPLMLALDQAIDKLADMDQRKARVVEMRFFAGMEDGEIAHVLAVSERTVKRDWIFARAFLFGVVHGEGA